MSHEKVTGNNSIIEEIQKSSYTQFCSLSTFDDKMFL